jgi:hypothetical protein
VTELLRRLPIPLPPAHGEVLTSYVGRLAVVHGLPHAELWNHLGVADRPGQRRRITLDRLATATGHPPGSLARALPELRDPPQQWASLRHLPQRACPRCAARHRGGPVRRLLAHHQYLCTRHGYWLGVPDPTQDEPPPPLAAQYPQLAAAQRRHQRLVTRHGWQTTFGAVVAATGICLDLRFSNADPNLWQRWEIRLDQLIPAEKRDYSRSRFLAVIHPEMIDLAVVIASPSWRATAASSDLEARQRFLDTAARRLGTSGWSADDPTHPAVSWAHTRAAKALAEPATTYPEAGRLYHDRSGLVEQERFAEQRTVRQFTSDRRAPHTYRTPLPYGHRHPHHHTKLRAGVHGDPESAPSRHLRELAAALPVQPAAPR